MVEYLAACKKFALNTPKKLWTMYYESPRWFKFEDAAFDL